MRAVGLVLILLFLGWLPGCSGSSKAKIRLPLMVGANVPQAAAQSTLVGTREYQAGHYEEAKAQFEQAVVDAPASAEAHYNLGLALFALGATDEARDHFIQAANLAPGNKVIWDSPALRPYGSPEPVVTKKKKDPSYSNQRPSFGGGPRY